MQPRCASSPIIRCSGRHRAAAELWTGAFERNHLRLTDVEIDVTGTGRL